MSSYLRFFELEHSPFEGEGQSQVVLGTRALKEALSTIRTGLEDGVARICVSGGSGMGKTSLARALPKLLGDEARVAVVLDPGVPWNDLRPSIARQWGREDGLARAGLIESSRERRLLIVIDQAEKADAEFLDHLDVILSYRSEEDRPVVQSVLIANLSTAGRPEPPPLVWWLDRIQTLQLEFAPLPREGVDAYIQKHLKRAGWRGERIFTPEAAETIHGYTAGIPREIGRVCEALLSRAAERDLQHIDADLVHEYCDGSDEADDAIESELDDLALEQALEHFASDDTSAEEETDACVTLTEEVPGTDGATPTEGEGEAAELELTTPVDGTELEAQAANDEHDGTPPLVLEAEPVASNDETDAAEEPPQTSFDVYLSRPPTAEELRALNGGFFTRYSRTVVGLTVATLVVAGLGFALLREPAPGVDGAYDETPGGIPRSGSAGESSWNPPAARPPAAEVILPGAEPRVLARVRGPVIRADVPIDDSPAPEQPGSNSAASSGPLATTAATTPNSGQAAPAAPTADAGTASDSIVPASSSSPTTGGTTTFHAPSPQGETANEQRRPTDPANAFSPTAPPAALETTPDGQAFEAEVPGAPDPPEADESRVEIDEPPNAPTPPSEPPSPAGDRLHTNERFW